MRHLPPIFCSVVNHKDQRYNTCGDYEKIGKGWDFSISKMGADYEFLVLIHELIEWRLTQKRGISEPQISKWDMIDVFKKDPKWQDNPGQSKLACYHKEHMFAEKIEKLIAKELNVDWNEYDKQIEAL